MKGIDIFMKQKIKENNDLFFILKKARSYIYYLLNKLSNYRLERKRFYNHLGYPLNLEKPSSFNEKIVWKKIYDRNPLLPITADKYEVRNYIKNVLGKEKANEILIPLLYVTDKPETIPFKLLPNNFIIKPNHASGMYVIVENGQYNRDEIVKSCRRWIRTPFGLRTLQWSYYSINRKIIIEKLLSEEDGTLPKRYKFHMFWGQCKMIQVFFGNSRESLVRHFGILWNVLPVKTPKHPTGPKIKKPKNYDNMLDLAEKLSRPFDYVRVDLYNINGKIYFSELTHYPSAGTWKFDPQSFDFELGKYWTIKPEYWKIDAKEKIGKNINQV